MENKTFSIPKISCGHCVMSIKNELTELEGVMNVEGNPENKTITIDFEAPASTEKIVETLNEINYPPA
ncbi:MAG: heavy-metal-associated domain-containing protein [Desulfobacterales bacterium]|jgi:copper chaperone|nr:heavy-metal-associated domain-containing protein [Desulfobacteraceae bacterium]MBT4364362.1 heavy-metal-associated domain-containing protein [Desulfobacteraceae bacterium]MBT7087058.1 heavy-metal-associated domain-containing protein [Desulfobacterales bacterium]MBT7696968.1 heavy-metal-associated domain-containing protein [Desulfobacterales bacterium]